MITGWLSDIYFIMATTIFAAIFHQQAKWAHSSSYRYLPALSK